MTTTREILDWLVEVELDRTPRSDEVLTEEDLAAWLPGCPDAAQAEAREAQVAKVAQVRGNPTATHTQTTPLPNVA